MSSTIYQSDHLAPVIDITAVRSRLRDSADPAVGDTLMVRCVLVSDDMVYRWVGIHEHTTIAECREVVATVFGIDGDVGSAADGQCQLREVLRSTGDVTVFSYGLWQFGMQLADIYSRDESTPPSVCVAGAGAFGGTPFNIVAVNAQLLGAERVKNIKTLLRDDAREVIQRAHTHDFVPLIQALGVDRATAEPEHPQAANPNQPDRDRLAALPTEPEPQQRDAFWAAALANACCADEQTTGWLTESIMKSLGWENLDATAIRNLCFGSLAELEELYADLPVAERLDVFRDLLRG